MLGKKDGNNLKKERDDAVSEPTPPTKKYCLSYDNIDGGVIIVQDNQIKFANSIMSQITGFSLGEIIGKTLPDFVAPQFKDLVSERYKRRMAGEDVPHRYELEINAKNGLFVPVEVNAFIIEHDESPADMAIFRDITERKEAEKSLRESEERLRQVADSADEWIWESDAEGMYTYSSPAVERILGYLPKELVGKKHYYDLYGSKIQEEFLKMAKEAIEQKRALRNFIYPNTHKNGEMVILETSSAPILDSQGNLLGYRGVDKDITERIRVEEALRQEKDYVRSIVDTARAIILTLDTQGRIVDFNPYMESFSGYSLDEVKGKDWFETFLPQYNREKTKEIFAIAIDGQKRVGNINSIVIKSGEERLVDWYDTPLKDKNGKITGLLVVGHDVTERKKAEQALSDELIRRRILVEQSRAGIVVLDENGAVFEANQHFINMVGYTPDEVKNLHLWDWSIEATREQLKNTLRSVDEKGRRFETKHRRKDGTVYDVEVSINGAFFADKKLVFCICHDITSRKEAEEALRKSEESYRFLADNAKDLIYRLRLLPTPRFEYVSPSATAITGFTPEDHYADPELGFKLVHPDDRAKLAEIMQSPEAAKHPIVLRWVKKDGSIIWTEQQNTPIFDDEGRVAAIEGIARDITSRKEAEEALRKSEEEYRTLFETMAQGVIFWDSAGKLISANKAAIDIWGLNLEVASDKTVFDGEIVAVTEEGLPFPKEEFPSVLALQNGQAVEGVVMGILKPSGKDYRWVVAGSRPRFRNGEKRPYQAYATFTDITQIKKIERDLIKSEEKLRQSINSWEATFNSIESVICLLDLDGTIINCNKAMNKLTGKTDKEIEGKKCYEVMQFASELTKSCPHFRSVKSGRRESGEFEIDNKWYYVAADPMFDSKGQVVGSVHIMEDITERKKMAEKMVLTDRLASIGELSSGITHELNNPLTSVVGLTQLMLEKENIAPDLLKDLQMINSEAQRAARIVKNLLVFARKHENEMHPASVENILEKVLELREYEQKVHNINVIRDYAPDLPYVSMDWFQIQQVFLNIVVNAEFAMSEANGGGTLTIKTEMVEGMVKISFIDNGRGIDPENIKHLFDPFFTTKVVGRGTGLGLSISHGIISQHHGNIYVKSKLGEGSVFTVELPLVQPKTDE
ncbi:MAG: PAS domain S-box protein [Dehalococcoidales bacterium]